MDSETHKRDNAYVIYEILKCDNSIRNTNQLDPNCHDETAPGGKCETVDPECAPAKAIRQWIRKKRASFMVINNKIDFMGYEDKMVR